VVCAKTGCEPAGKLMLVTTVGVLVLLAETVSSAVFATYSLVPFGMRVACVGATPVGKTPSVVSPETSRRLAEPGSTDPFVVREITKWNAAGLGGGRGIGCATGR
jgi:hypothetical protein